MLNKLLLNIVNEIYVLFKESRFSSQLHQLPLELQSSNLDTKC